MLKGLKPFYEQKLLPVDQRNSLVVFPVTIHQDAKIFRGRVADGHELIYKMSKERGAWVQVISGLLSINSNALEAGDAAIVEKETNLHFNSKTNCEFLLFDLK